MANGVKPHFISCWRCVTTTLITYSFYKCLCITQKLYTKTKGINKKKEEIRLYRIEYSVLKKTTAIFINIKRSNGKVIFFITLVESVFVDPYVVTSFGRSQTVVPLMYILWDVCKQNTKIEILTIVNLKKKTETFVGMIRVRPVCSMLIWVYTQTWKTRKFDKHLIIRSKNSHYSLCLYLVYLSYPDFRFKTRD